MGNTASFLHIVCSPSFLKKPTLFWAAMCSAKNSLLQTPFSLRWPTAPILGPLSLVRFSPKRHLKHINCLYSISLHAAHVHASSQDPRPQHTVLDTKPGLTEQVLQEGVGGTQCRAAQRLLESFFQMYLWPSAL